MSFIKYLREEEKKAKSKKKEKKEEGITDAQKATPGNSPDAVPGAVMGQVANPQQPPVDNVVSIENQGNLEAYNTMRAFAMGMENNMSGITLLKNHPTPEIAEQATVLEKDAREIIQYIMSMQIPI